MKIINPTVIAEIGCNHRGEMETAHQMLKVISAFKSLDQQSKIDIVKFQKRTNKELLTPEEYNAPHPHPENSYGATYGLHREALEFTVEQHAQLKAWCEEEGLIYSTSVWDLTAAKEIASLNPVLIKVPSACNLDFKLLKYLRDNYSGEIHLSFGMTTKAEEKQIIDFFAEKNRTKDLVIYACTSGYPVPPEDVCLYEITRIKEAYGDIVKAVGFSGHHNGIAIDVAALTLGATYFERHFTLNRTWKGTDHAASLEPQGMQKLARDLRNVSKALTYKSQDILPIEAVQRKKLKHVKDETVYMKNKKVVAFIPVRGGSKSIPLKNIKEFCGKPLVYWTAMAAAECNLIDEVYVSTDSKEIADVVKKFAHDKIQIAARSTETATDIASTESAMIEFARNYDFTDIVLIQATSPLLEAEDLSNGISDYFENGYDSLLSVVPQKRFIWNGEGIPQNYEPVHRPRRQEMEGYFVENGAFYITTKKALLETGSRLSGKTGMYKMLEDTYFEIDEPSDWLIAEKLKKQRLMNVASDFSKINLLVTDVDGVLTDAGMYYDNEKGELKKFNTRDGMGISFLRSAGVKVMILTSEETDIVKRRSEKLKVDFCFMGVKDKKKFLGNFFAEHSEFAFDKTAYIGDDINDLEVLNAVDFSFVPNDAVEICKESAKYICKTAGGKGCVREVCDMICANLVYANRNTGGGV